MKTAKTTLINLHGRHIRPGDAVIRKDGEVISRNQWIYIGRAVRDRKTGILRIPESRWYNRFKEGEDGTFEEIIAKYEAGILANPELLARLPVLKGKCLACWCTPKPCHGGVLIRLSNQSSSGLDYRRPRER
jgi:hypothetical protein